MELYCCKCDYELTDAIKNNISIICPKCKQENILYIDEYEVDNQLHCEQWLAPKK